MKTQNVGRMAMGGLGVSALMGGSFVVMTARAQENNKPIPPPIGKITPWAAIKSATAKVPGRALNANFEFDEGKWIYGVIIVSGKTLKEVTVDPMTGKAGDVETITPDGEAKETRSELMAAIGEKPTGSAEDAGGGEKKEADEKDEKPEKP